MELLLGAAGAKADAEAARTIRAAADFMVMVQEELLSDVRLSSSAAMELLDAAVGIGCNELRQR